MMHLGAWRARVEPFLLERQREANMLKTSVKQKVRAHRQFEKKLRDTFTACAYSGHKTALRSREARSASLY